MYVCMYVCITSTALLLWLRWIEHVDNLKNNIN